MVAKICFFRSALALKGSTLLVITQVRKWGSEERFLKTEILRWF